MTEKYDPATWKENWQRLIVDSGIFDKIEHPENGYKLEESVAGRDGIVYGVIGFTGDGKLLLSDGKSEKIVDKDFVRPGGDVGEALIRLGMVNKSAEDTIYIEPTETFPGKDSENN